MYLDDTGLDQVFKEIKTRLDKKANAGDTFTPATSTTDGKSGLVPAPTKGTGSNGFLGSDSKWHSTTEVTSDLNLSKTGGGTDQYISSITETFGKINATVGTLPNYTFEITPNSTNDQVDFSVKKDNTGLLQKTLDFRHTHKFSDIQEKPSTLSGYGITDAISKSEFSMVGNLPVVNHGTADTTFTLTPNTLHIWGTVSTLSLTLGTEVSGVVNEFMFQFTCPENAGTTLTLPGTIKWYNDQIILIDPGYTYQGSILNNILVIGYSK